MPNHASVTLIGHLGKDPVTRTPHGASESVTSFSIATTVKRRDQETTTWWNCSAWGKRGEIVQRFLHKGDPLMVQGEPLLRTYTTQDGREGQSLEVSVSSVTLLGSRSGAQSAPDGLVGAHLAGHSPAPQNALHGNLDEDIPF